MRTRWLRAHQRIRCSEHVESGMVCLNWAAWSRRAGPFTQYVCTTHRKLIDRREAGA